MHARPLVTSDNPLLQTRLGSEPSGQGGEPVAPAGDDDALLVALGGKLHAAAGVAERRLKALPDYGAIAQEAAAIEAILQPGEAIADRMLCLRPVTSAGHAALLRAELWKRGEYIGTYLGPG